MTLTEQTFNFHGITDEARQAILTHGGVIEPDGASAVGAIEKATVQGFKSLDKTSGHHDSYLAEMVIVLADGTRLERIKANRRVTVTVI